MANVYFIAGLGFGDEGKGTIVDFLTEQLGSKDVVRYNGGPQAAHHVVNNGSTHCFSQFGSGSFSDSVRTYLSKLMLVDPITLSVEEEALRQIGITDGFQRLNVDKDCIVITPMQKIVGQMRESAIRYGSCGMGVGETVSDSQSLKGYTLRVADLNDAQTLQSKLDFLWRFKLDHAEQLAEQNPDNSFIQSHYSKVSDPSLVQRLIDSYQRFAGKVTVVDDYEIESQTIFEGAQGVLLDVNYGFSPHITKTDTTFANACKIVGNKGVKRIGVLRAYGTRHGVGPFVAEDKQLTHDIPDVHNGTHEWQGQFRIGWFDMLASSYALDVIGGVDMLAITNLDRLRSRDSIQICTAYEYSGNGDLDGLFDYEVVNGKKFIHKIKAQNNPDVNTQNQLTRSLFECKPIYTEMRADADSYLALIENKLATAISIVSTGPERKDKTVIKNI